MPDPCAHYWREDRRYSARIMRYEMDYRQKYRHARRMLKVVELKSTKWRCRKCGAETWMPCSQAPECRMGTRLTLIED